MTSRVNTNISTISVDDIAVLTMTVVDTEVGWGSRVGVGSLVASEMVKEGLQYKKITLTFVINAASVPSQNWVAKKPLSKDVDGGEEVVSVKHEAQAQIFRHAPDLRVRP